MYLVKKEKYFFPGRDSTAAVSKAAGGKAGDEDAEN